MKIKLAALSIFTLFLTSRQSHAQSQSSVDSIFSAMHTAALMAVKTMPPSFRNPEFYQMALEQAFESIALKPFAARLAINPDDTEAQIFANRMMENRAKRRVEIARWIPDLLATGSIPELRAATNILYIGPDERYGDTSGDWDAYLLSSRAASLGDAEAQRVAEIALEAYISKHGKRVNGDSIFSDWKVRYAYHTNDGWTLSYSEALATAQKAKQNIFIDFTGHMNTNSRAMERTVFSREDVKDLLEPFVLARLFCDGGTPLEDSNAALEESRFHSVACPYYVILSPSGKPLATFPGFTRDAEAFKSFLRLDKKYRWKNR